jgi:hypothetical protein
MVMNAFAQMLEDLMFFNFTFAIKLNLGVLMKEKLANLHFKCK